MRAPAGLRWGSLLAAALLVTGGTAHAAPHPGPAGTRDVRGEIERTWLRLGGVAGPLGAPLTDELSTPDGRGRYTHFQHGSVYWTPATGAHEVRGAIRDTWQRTGWERGPLGYPTGGTGTSPYSDWQAFQGGTLSASLLDGRVRTAKRSYADCTDVWGTLESPVQRGQHGYGPALDGDGDGTGCEDDPRRAGAVGVERFGAALTRFVQGAAWTERSWDADDSALDPAGVLTTRRISVRLVPRDGSEPFGFDLSRSDGAPLGTGYHPDPGTRSRVGNGSWGGVERNVSVGGLGLWSRSGDVEVRDLVADASGRITRLHVLFRTPSTRTPTDAVLGELRIGEPVAQEVALSRTAVRFPDQAVAGRAVPVVEVVRNTSALPQRVGRLTVTGSRAGGGDADFRLADDTCSGRLLPAGGSCTARVLFSPSRPGPRTGLLVVPLGRSTARAQLDGRGTPGRSELLARSSGPGWSRTARWVDGPDHRVVGGVDLDTQRLSVAAVDQRNGETVHPYLRITAPRGERLAPGRHATTGRSALPGGWELDVTTASTAPCNTTRGWVDIDRLEQDPDGTVVAAHLTFSDTCRDTTELTVSGEAWWGAREDTTGPGAVLRPAVSAPGGGAPRVLTWAAPAVPDHLTTLVRFTSGEAPAPDPGTGASPVSATGTSAVVPDLAPGSRWTATFFTVDRSGNVSAAGSLPLRG